LRPATNKSLMALSGSNIKEMAMAYGTVVKVPAPIEAYLASHAEVEKTIGDVVPVGLIFHAARPTDSGFEIYEVWESKAQADKFNEEVVWPAIARSGGDPAATPPEVVEFEPVGLMAAGK
jgi:hypothetical protein